MAVVVDIDVVMVGLGVVLCGLTLLVVAMKGFLHQAIGRDSDARTLQSELEDEVI